MGPLGATTRVLHFFQPRTAAQHQKRDVRAVTPSSQGGRRGGCQNVQLKMGY